MHQNDQKSWDKTFIEFAEVIAQKSHCARLKVGALLVKNNRIISLGYNGSPSGFPNCDEINTNLDLIESTEKDLELHHKFSEQFEIHAEMNCILDAAKRGESPIGCTLYTTIAPCKNCAKLVFAAGIKRVVYKSLYDRDGGYSIKTNGDADDAIQNKKFFEDYNGPDILVLMGHEKDNDDKIEICEYNN